MAQCVCFCDRALSPCLPKDGIRWESGNSGMLCAISPSAAEQLITRPLYFQTLLVPEGIYSPAWQARQVVSCGLSAHSSLTLSSMDGRDMLCIQRSLADRSGHIVEPQELLLPAAWGAFPPADRLLLAGIWLYWSGSLPDCDS